MYSGSRKSWEGRRPYNSQPRPRIQENTLHRSEIFIERKEFLFVLKENPRGRFIRIAEHNGNRPPNSIIIPSTGLRDFQKLLDEMVVASDEIKQLK